MALYIPNIYLFILQLIFNETFSNSDYAARSDKLERMWKKAVVT